MAAPSQIQVRYIPEEDRVLMRMNTVAGEEFRFWLTRRYLLRMWPVLQEALLSSPTARRQKDFSAQQAVVAFEQEKARSKAEFNSAFRETDKLPLGKDPLLVVQSGFRHLEDGSAFLVSLKNPQMEGIELTLTSDLLHLLCKMLDEAVQQYSDWDMPALIPNPTESAAPVAAHRLN